MVRVILYQVRFNASLPEESGFFMEKAPIHQLIDTFLDEEDHDIFVLPPDKYKELIAAIPPMQKQSLEELGPTNCMYFGKWYPCIAYRECAFINAKDIR